MPNTKSSKSAKIFNCEMCHFICFKKSGYEKHILTLKHKKHSDLTTFKQSFNTKSANKRIYLSKIVINYTNPG